MSVSISKSHQVIFELNKIRSGLHSINNVSTKQTNIYRYISKITCKYRTPEDNGLNK